MPPETSHTVYAVEYSCKVNTAATEITTEMSACLGTFSEEGGSGPGPGLTFSAWDDGTNWDDGSVGWLDWPPPGADL